MVVAVPAGRSARRGARRLAGPSTMAKIYGTLRTALNDAVDNRLIGFNPCRGVELPENDQAEIEPWEAHNIGRFLDEAAMDPLSAMYELIALHGLRRGEACGATWDGLDDEAGVLTIRQQITDTGGDLGVWAPKIKSGRRKVDLDPTTLNSLALHRLAQDADRKRIATWWDNGTLPDQHGRPVHLQGLMFTRPDGRHLAPQYVTSHMWHIAKRVGLCCALTREANQGDMTITVGKRYAEPQGTWTLYADREPVDLGCRP